MAEGDPLPDAHHVSRYCGFDKLSEDGRRPLMVAFQFSLSDNPSSAPAHLSVNWLEYFEERSREQQVDEVRLVLREKFKRVGAKAALAILEVNEMRRRFKEVAGDVDVLHWPVHGTGPRGNAYRDPSHAGVFSVETDPDLIATILSGINCELVPARLG